MVNNQNSIPIAPINSNIKKNSIIIDISNDKNNNNTNVNINNTNKTNNTNESNLLSFQDELKLKSEKYTKNMTVFEGSSTNIGK